MALRRMFSQKIVGSDAFIDMPVSARELYFQLGMYADDDGFINPKKIIRMIGASEDDLKILIGKRFVLTFENGVIVIKHWKINNMIRKDFYQKTIYEEQKKCLMLNENNSYTENVNSLLTDCKHNIIKLNLNKLNNNIDSSQQVDSPSMIANDFLNDMDSEYRVKFINELIKKGIDENTVRRELTKFISYWTEPTKNGKKQRWELEKTFEVGRRLATWFSKSSQYNFNKSNIVIV